jgi:hypothetical protein
MVRLIVGVGTLEECDELRVSAYPFDFANQNEARAFLEGAIFAARGEREVFIVQTRSTPIDRCR